MNIWYLLVFILLIIFFYLIYIYICTKLIFSNHMKLSMNNFRKNARHLFLMVVCFVMVAGVSSCGKESALEPSEPIGTDDASLLKWQMEEFINTRSASFDIALVTTVTNFESGLACNGDHLIDWGDGTVENNTESHTYTDGESAHTIFIYGDFNGAESGVFTDGQNLIYADISRCPGLKNFTATNSRLTNIDLSKNTSLEDLTVTGNKLSSLDLSNTVNLMYLHIEANPIRNINVTKLPHLWSLFAKETLIQNIDLSNNKELVMLITSDSPVTSININNCTKLIHFYCNRCPIDKLDVSQNTEMGALECNGTKITSLNLSKAKGIWALYCSNSNINDITLSSDLYDFCDLDIRNTPIEQDMRKMTNLALSLPNRSETLSGALRTSTPHLSIVSSLLEGYNWDINPY